MPLRAVAFDWGHTVMDECRDRDIPLGARPVHLMPGVSEVLPQITFPLALWATTRVATEADVRGWLKRAGLNRLFRWVITAVDAGAPEPAPQFLEYVLLGWFPGYTTRCSGVQAMSRARRKWTLIVPEVTLGLMFGTLLSQWTSQPPESRCDERFASELQADDQY